MRALQAVSTQKTGSAQSGGGQPALRSAATPSRSASRHANACSCSSSTRPLRSSPAAAGANRYAAETHTSAGVSNTFRSTKLDSPGFFSTVYGNVHAEDDLQRSEAVVRQRARFAAGRVDDERQHQRGGGGQQRLGGAPEQEAERDAAAAARAVGEMR